MRLTLCLLSMLLIASLVFAADNALKKEFQTKYNTIMAAMNKGDLAAVEKMIPATMTFKGEAGQKLSKTQWLEMIKKQTKALASYHLGCTVKSVTVKGSTATVMQELSFTGKVKDDKGKMHTLSSKALGRDIWVKANGKWTPQSSEDIKVTRMMDGKPYQPQR